MTADIVRQIPMDQPRVSTSRLHLVALMLGALVLYTVNVDFAIYGDAAMYSDYVVLRKFDELTLHLGYYVALFGMHAVLGGLFGVPIEQAAVWLNVVAGTLSVGVAYLLAAELFGNRRDALLCSIVFAVSGRVLTNSTTSEIYMLQTLFVLSSFYLFVRERVVLSGIACALALLVSPLSAFAYLFYPVYDYQRAGIIRWSVLLRLAGVGLLIYVPYLVIDGHELLFGLRGLLVIRDIVKDDPLASIKHFPVYQFKAFSVMALLVVPALLAWRANTRLIVLALAVAIPHLYIIFKLTGEDHVFILNTDFFFAACIVTGWRQLERFAAVQWIPPILLAGHLALFIASGTIHRFEPHRDYADGMRQVVAKYLRGRDAIIVTDWSRAVGLTFFGRPTPTTTLLEEPLFKEQIFDIQGAPMPPLSRLDRPEIFLLDSWTTSPLNTFLRSRASLETLRQEHSIVTIADRVLGLQCTLVEETVHPIYKCVRRRT